MTFAYGTMTDAFGKEIMTIDASRVPDAVVEEHHELGHFGPLERPDAMADGVRRALTFPDGTTGP